MRSKKTRIICLLIVVCALKGTAQPFPGNSNLRSRYLHVQQGPIAIDSLSIVPGTFLMDNIGPGDYLLDNLKARLTFINLPGTDSVHVSYRVFLFSIMPKAAGYDYDSIRFNFLDNPVKMPLTGPSGTGIIDFRGLDANGSIGRLLSFGNAQDAVVNSSMNLQLHGFIGDSLELTAAISDNNLPVQPDGNTQNLRDLDRILLQIGKKNWQASFGDIELKENKDRFLSFNKRLQGGLFQTRFAAGKSNSNMLKLEGAIARGKYNRNIFTGTEGNQGPYRLTGANSELYFVVLAGTERVYIDGELMERGTDRDYVINYNGAEINFTAKRMIQKDSRIQVEFEYADRSYLNSQLYFQDEFSLGEKLTFRLSAYSNADAKNSPIDQILNPGEKQFLASVGDSIQNAYYNTESPDQYSPGKLLYKKADTLYRGTQRDTIYVLSSDSSLELFSVGFTYLGPGKGNYSRLLNVTNGKAYQWIMPDTNNMPMGDYEPVSLLVTPKKLQIATASVTYQDLKGGNYTAEMAVSNRDVNLFAPADKTDNTGKAFKITAKQDIGKFKAGKSQWTLTAQAGHEYVGKRFQPAERIRNVEFFRDWSLPNNPEAADENLSTAGFVLKADSGSRFFYEGTRYERKGNYTGYRHLMEQTLKAGPWLLTGRINMLYFTSGNEKGNYFKPFAEMKRAFRSGNNVEFMVRYQAEFNKPEIMGTDSLAPSAFGFEIYQASLTSGRGKPDNWQFNYFRRQDKLPSGGKLVNANKSDNYQFNTGFYSSPSLQVNSSVSYRRLHIDNESLSKVKAEESLLARLEWVATALKGFATGNSFFEMGSGQELKREFSYVEVPAGQGEYTWIDYNNNGIEELNEFEIAIYPDQKKYIRVFTPGTTYIKANYLQFNFSADLNPSVLFKKKSRLADILSRASSTSSFQTSMKKTATGLAFINPFVSNLYDSNLLAGSGFYSNTIFYNRSSAQWGMEATHTKSLTRSLLAYGFETRETEWLTGKARVRLRKQWLGSFTVRRGMDLLTSENAAFLNRNYRIRKLSWDPSLAYLYKSNLRIQLTWSRYFRNNELISGESVSGNDLTAEFKYNVLSGTVFSGQFSYDKMDWKGSPGSQNSTSGYILLEGLQPGKNFLWSTDIIKRIGKNLEMNIRYEGRKPGNTRVIHTGRAGIRALF